jgi:hypothetical protein
VIRLLLAMVAALVLQAPGSASSPGSGSSRRDERGSVAPQSPAAPALLEHSGGDAVALLPWPATRGERVPFAPVVIGWKGPPLPAALARLWLRDCRLLC